MVRKPCGAWGLARYSHHADRISCPSPGGLATFPTTPIESPILQDALSRGNDAIASHEWEAAATCFRQALSEQPSAEAWEGLAISTSYLDQDSATVDARERAIRLYRESGNAAGAARCAIWLANDIMEFRGDWAVADGWLQRAASLLSTVTGPTPEAAVLLGFRAHMALQGHGDPVAARALAVQSRTVSRACGAVDVEMMALAIEGLSLVNEGRVQEGMRMLDEATIAAVSGEMSDPNLIGTSCCYLIHACERIRDYPRAIQWSAHVRKLAEQWQLGSFFVVCRTQYASILMCRGEFTAAEKELEAALRHAELHRPALARGAIVRLGELRRRQGRFGEAEELFAQMGTHRMAALGRGLIALQRNEHQNALECFEGLLRRTPTENLTERVAILEGMIRALAAVSRIDDAERFVRQLEEIAATVNTDPLRAAACAARANVLAAASRHAEARDAFTDAIVGYEASGESHELARNRLALARSLALLGRRAEALQQARVSATSLEAMGADADAREAHTLIRSISGGRKDLKSSPQITIRELDVLRLIAAGHGDKAIANRLDLSEHTIHRHVSNILRKLGVSSRAAAASWAARRQLV